MPEREVSEAQRELVEEWIRKQKGGFIKGLTPVSCDDGDEPAFVHNAWYVDGEPLVIAQGEEFRDGKLFCSKRHARQLEKAGIVRFTPEPQQGVRTP